MQKLKDSSMKANFIELIQMIAPVAERIEKTIKGLEKIAKLDVDKRTEKIERGLLEIVGREKEGLQKAIEKLKRDFGELTFGEWSEGDFSKFDKKCDAIGGGISKN